MEARHLLWIASVIAALGLISCGKPDPEKLTYRIVSAKPHEADAYTQGLQLSNGRLFESTGQYGQSTVREIDSASGSLLRKRPLAKQVFGEGLTLLGNEVWVLTWKENTAYVFEPDSFNFIRSLHYQGEGWGLTNNGKELIMSDGSSTLKFIKPGDFSTIRTLTVKDGDREIKDLNELEWIDGQIFANIYMTERIARISPETGEITGWLDLTGLRNQFAKPNNAEVLNGIAHDPKTGHLIVTGKYWPRMFEIELGKK